MVPYTQILPINKLKKIPSWSFSSWCSNSRCRRDAYLIGWASMPGHCSHMAVSYCFLHSQKRELGAVSQKNPGCHLGSLKAPNIKKWHTPEQVWYIFLSAEGSGMHSRAIHHVAKIRSCLEGMIYYWLRNKDSYISHEKQKGEISLGGGQIYPWCEKWIH